jgi:hypothetical protein
MRQRACKLISSILAKWQPNKSGKVFMMHCFGLRAQSTKGKRFPSLETHHPQGFVLFKEKLSFNGPSIQASALGSPVGLQIKLPGSSVASTLWRNSGKYQHQIFNGNTKIALLHKGKKEPSVRASPADPQVRDRFGHTEQTKAQAMRMPRPESW